LHGSDGRRKECFEAAVEGLLLRRVVSFGLIDIEMQYGRKIFGNQNLSLHL
jgi:hypothetical protein